MARIGTDRMIVHGEQRQDKTWLFTICYTAYFTERDLGMRFDDSVRVGETGVPAVAFTATSPAVFRKKRIVVRDKVLHADAHHSVCAWIRLHCATPTDAPVDDEQRTPELVPTAAQSPRC
ncbi:hypothetical protein BH09ACT7_BH09ACT7_03680 [soil metagenome]